LTEAIEPTPATVEADPNAALRATLRDYLNRPQSQRYAILLTGPWGVGKTHLITTFLSQEFSHKNCYHVSLAGCADKRGFDEAVFGAIYPQLTGKSGKIGGMLLSAAAKFGGVTVPDGLHTLLETAQNGIYVFDDLERSDLPVTHVLKYINPYVEHAAAKVIVIANTLKVENLEEFNAQKEKTIGRTIEVKPALDAALEHFLDQIDDEAAKRHISECRELISRVYQQSGIGNLRALQQSLWDVESLIKAAAGLGEVLEDGLSNLLSIFLAIALESKMGFLDEEDLAELRDPNAAVLRLLAPDAKPTATERVQSRHPDLDLDDTLLSADTLGDCLFRGAFDPEKIVSELRQTSRFSIPDSEPEWRVLWDSVRRTSSELNDAMRAMQRKYDAGEYRISGEILHVVAIRLELAKQGILKETAPEIVASAKAYISDRMDRGQLTPLGPNAQSEHADEGYDGRVYHNLHAEEFRDVFDHLTRCRLTAYKKYIKASAPALLLTLRDEPLAFVRQITGEGGLEEHFGYSAILSKIPVAEFLDTLLTLVPRDQFEVMRAFPVRYRPGCFEQELSSELDWLTELEALLQETVEAAEPFEAFRLQRLKNWYVTKLVEPFRTPPGGEETDATIPSKEAGEA
tara:strand:- start:190 stop:2079 length:1890 start_codon:yes stop_codon:yes gene_type:complete